MQRSILNALLFACLLAVAAAAALPRDALAHGGSHGHAAPSAGAGTTATSGDERLGPQYVRAHRVAEPGALALAAAPSHCPDGPFGACCCVRARLLNYIPALAGAEREALVMPWPTKRYLVHVRDDAPHPAFFRLGAPPRAPPSAPVTA